MQSGKCTLWKRYSYEIIWSGTTSPLLHIWFVSATNLTRYSATVSWSFIWKGKYYLLNVYNKSLQMSPTHPLMFHIAQSSQNYLHHHIDERPSSFFPQFVKLWASVAPSSSADILQSLSQEHLGIWMSLSLICTTHRS